MEGISLGSAFLRLYGDRSALDRELEILKRYTDQLEKKGITVKFDADTGRATREVEGLTNKLSGLNDILQTVGQGLQGDSSAWRGLAESLGGIGGAAGGSVGGLDRFGGALGGAVGMVGRALPVLAQLGLAAQGLQAIWFGVSAAIGSVLRPLQQLSQEAGRFNQQVAEAGIFTSQSFAILGPDGKALEGTANQMRQVRGVITREYREIQKEVAQISGATASQIYEGFNLILQNSNSLGKEGESLANIRKLSTRIAAGANTLGVPGEQMRSEVQSLLTGDVQVYDQLANKLYGPGAREKIQQLQAEGKYYDDLMQKLEKLYDGQKVLADSLTNVQSNFQDVFETINSEGAQALERGLAGGLKAVLQSLDRLQGSFKGALRGVSEALEPILGFLGEIGGWLVSAGSLIASVIQVVGDLAALVLNAFGVILLPMMRGLGGLIQVVAKGVQLLATLVSSILRPITAFFRIITGEANKGVDDALDPVLDFFDKAIAGAEALAAVVARPFIEMAKGVAWLRGKLSGLSDKEIQQRQSEIEAQFSTSIGGAAEPDLRSLRLSRSTTELLDQRQQRLGTGSTRQLNEAKELSQLVQDRIKNEIQGLEQSLKLMGAQKGLQEQLNQLAEGRRGLASSRANFAIQLASSPEARLAAEESRNDLAQRQEQERIQERRALLGTEREMLQMQLQIQLRQQRLQQEQLKIQRLEIVLQRDKAAAAISDIRQRMMLLRANSPEYKGLLTQYNEAGLELKYRNQQLQVIDRTVGLQREMVGIVQQTNALEARGLDIKEQQLGVQAQMAGLTREQQALMADLQRQEQEITNQRDRYVQGVQELISDREKEIRQLQEQEKTTERLQRLAESRLELQKAQTAAASQAAEAQLKVAQAQQQASTNPTSVQAVIGAQIEALAAGAQGFVSEADATRQLYAAKQRQLELEQEQQRQQLTAQQMRESSEQRIAELNLQRLVLEQKVTQARLQAEKDLLGLRQQRDSMSGLQAAAAGDATTIPIGTWVGGGAPPAPVLPPPQGAGRGGNLSSQARALVAAASTLGVSPLDLATIIGFETGGTYSPSKWGGAGGNYMGLIQFGPNERRAYGAHQGQSFEEQVQGPVVRYFQDRFRGVGMSTQGADLLTLYRTVLGGNPKANIDSRDAFGTSPRSGVGLMAPHRAEAMRRFFGGDPANIPGAGAPVAEVNSLQNAIDQNTDALKRSFDLEKELTDAFKKLQGTKPDLLLQQSNARQSLAASQQAQQDAMRIDRNRATLTAEVLGTPRGRLAGQLTEAVAGTLGNGLRGVLQQAFQGEGFDLAGLAEGISRTMAERFSGALVDAALAPIEQAITQNLFRQFSGVDIEEQARLLTQQQAADGQQRAANTMQRAADTMLQAAQGGPTGGGSGSSALTPYTMQPLQVALSDSAEGLGQSMDAAAQTIDVVATTAGQAAGGFQGLMQSFGKVAAVLGGVAMGVGGAQQMGKGGTYNTLMGLAGIFGSIGSIAGMFGGAGGGGGGGSVYTMPMLTGVPGRAYGGPVTSNQAYKVGENGVELFVPSSSGTIIPNDQTQALLATRNALRGGAMAQMGSGSGAGFQASREALERSDALARERTTERVLATSLAAPSGPIRYQAEVINRVDYVSAEQFERGLREAETRGAERGRALTLGALKNSVKARRQVGI